MLRARTKAYRYFHENEKGTAETLAKYTRLDLVDDNGNLSYVASSALQPTACSADKDDGNFCCSDDAKTLGLAQPVAPAKVFDFNPQREINKELGIK